MKRPFTFYLSCDDTLMRDGTRLKDWLKVGVEVDGKYISNIYLFVDNNTRFLEYLTYEELPISSLYAVASPTFFINNGDRRNCGKIGDAGTYEPEGVFIGLVGARFEHADR